MSRGAGRRNRGLVRYSACAKSTEIFFLEPILPAAARRAAGRVLAAALVATAALAHAGPPMPVAHVRVASHPLRVEVAASVEQRMKGLMFRDKLAKDDG